MATFSLPHPNMDKLEQVNLQTLAEEINKVKAYLFSLNNQLRYNFSNNDGKNFRSGLDPVTGAITQRVSDLEGNQSVIQQTAVSITLEVDAKVTTFSQDAIPTSTAIGDLWIDTNDNNKLYRAECVGADAITAGEWVLFKIAAGYVSTSKITVDGTGIAILTGGTFTVASANFEIDSSGNVTMSGTVTASAGKIGGTSGFTIGSGKLYSGKSSLTSTTAGIYIGTDGIAMGPTGGTYVKILPNSSMLIGAIANNGNYIDFGDASYLIFYNNAYTVGNMSAQSFTDRTPAFTGDALTALASVKDDGHGKIDHTSLPTFAQKNAKGPVLDSKGDPIKDDKGKIVMVDEPGRDLGAMISILTKGVQQLTALVDAQQKEIDKLVKNGA